MLFGIKHYFFIIIGETDDVRCQTMYQRMESLGNVVCIMDRSYILTITNDDIVNINKVVESICGRERYIVYASRIDGDTSASWCLKTDNSQYLKSIFNEVNA